VENVCSVMKEIVIEAGSLRDYRAMARWHYRSGLPAAATRVLVAWHVCPGGARRRRAGVIVEAMPVLASRARDLATGGRYRPRSRERVDLRDAAMLVNGEIRSISRVVVQPAFRGIGLGVKLVRAILESARSEIVEAHAAMGGVNPFFEKAGMSRLEASGGGKEYYIWRKVLSAEERFE
jgi:GNAT superfamily N-acetyltransferase